MPPTPDPAVSICFKVVIGHRNLGLWSSCEGLAMELVLEQREEGGNNDFIHQLPVRLKYPNIKLTRPLYEDSEQLVPWLCELAGKLERTTAAISAMTLDNKVVATWNLQEVIPVRWTGPSLNVDTLKPATETLELAHHGFLGG